MKLSNAYTTLSNWQRDYSQIRDTSSLSILPSDVILGLVKLVGYIQYDYGKRPGFDITDDNLGVFLAVSSLVCVESSSEPVAG